MKLTVGLVHYKENEETVSHALGMIDIQKNFNLGDVEVLLVDDGPESYKLSDEFLDSFKHLKKHNCIKHIMNDYITKRPFEQDDVFTNGGPGLVRQKIIDIATGDWITFIDIDDNWHNAYILSMFNEMIYSTDLEFVTTDWVSPIKSKDGRWQYPMHHQDLTWVFGKFFRRDFLKTMRLRHSEELRVHEDSYFLRIVSPSTDKKKHIPYTTYVWNQSEDSITRNNGAEYSYTSFQTYIRANDLVLKEKMIRKRDDLIKDSAQNIVYFYYATHNADWDKPDAKDYVQPTLEMCSYFYNEWKDYIEKSKSIDIKGQKVDWVKENLKAQQAKICTKIPNETFEQWIQKLKDLNITKLPFYKTATIEMQKRGVASE